MKKTWFVYIYIYIWGPIFFFFVFFFFLLLFSSLLLFLKYSVQWLIFAFSALVCPLEWGNEEKGPLLCTSEFAKEFLLQDSRSKKSHYPRSRMESRSGKSSKTELNGLSRQREIEEDKHRSPMTSRSQQEKKTKRRQKNADV